MTIEENITQDDLDLLADILWWIKGYQAGSECCAFDLCHFEAIRKVRNYFLEKYKKEKP